jgi:hypothetical protein
MTHLTEVTPGMQGYAWAKTPAGELFIVLIVDGQGYVPGVENATDLSQVDILVPVKWPAAITRPSSGGGPAIEFELKRRVVMRDIAGDGEVANAD